MKEMEVKHGAVQPTDSTFVAATAGAWSALDWIIPDDTILPAAFQQFPRARIRSGWGERPSVLPRPLLYHPGNDR